MGNSFEWPITNINISYPFMDHLDSDSGLHELFADAYIVHNKERTRTGRIKLTQFDPAGDCRLEFEDATSLCVLTASDNFTSTTYGPWTVLQWYKQTEATVYTDEEVVVRFLLYTAKLGDFSFPVTPTDAWINPANICPAAERVNRFIVKQPPPLSTMETVKQAAIFQCGYNVRIDQRTTRQTTGLELPTTSTDPKPATYLIFNAIPGEGEGKYPCQATFGVKTINGVGPDANGNFFIEPKDCYWLERPLADPPGAPISPGTDYLSDVVPATLTMHNNCSPCCACNDYVAVYQNMARLWNRAKVAAARIEATRQKYQAIRELILAIKAAKETGLTTSLRVLSRPDFTVSIMGIIANNSATDILSSVTVEFDLEYTPDVLTSTYIPRSGVIDAEEQHGKQLDPSVGSESYTITLPYLRKTRFAVYSFDVRFGKSSDPNVSRTAVSVKVRSTATNGAQSSSATKYITLEKPITKT